MLGRPDDFNQAEPISESVPDPDDAPITVM
jgi:hypothetical protein